MTPKLPQGLEERVEALLALANSYADKGMFAAAYGDLQAAAGLVSSLASFAREQMRDAAAAPPVEQRERDEPTYTRSVQVYPDAMMSVPERNADPHIVWQMTWGGEVSKRQRVAAASLIDSYSYLLSDNITMTEATNRLRKLRDAYQDAARSKP